VGGDEKRTWNSKHLAPKIHNKFTRIRAGSSITIKKSNSKKQINMMMISSIEDDRLPFL
jgi:hypothetical protein